MRSGAGLVTLGVPEGIARPIIKIKSEEVMLFPLPQTAETTLSFSGYKKIKDFSKGADIMVVGPGLSANPSTQRLARKIISGIDKPMVIDADGLNALAGHLDLLAKRRDSVSVLTPHPGEMARLLGTTIKKVQANRRGIAAKFARDHHVTLVLKGYGTVIADYNGNLHINESGNPGMATGGTGDVLAGMVAAFLGLGLGAFEAAKYAAYAHGAAGDLAAKEKTQLSLIASDIIEKIPSAIKKNN